MDFINKKAILTKIEIEIIQIILKYLLSLSKGKYKKLIIAVITIEKYIIENKEKFE